MDACMTAGHTVSTTDILAARARLGPHVRRTPLVPSPSLGEHTAGDVYLKLENQQQTGSFKLRGATNAVANLTAEQRASGVVTVSTGNHGRGLAFAAREAGVRCIVCMSSLVPQNKVDGIRAQGAEVRIVGNLQDEAESEADRLVVEDGMTLLPPFDHPHIIAGQGTLGLEMIEQCPHARTFVVPMSGGGLISGVATAVKSVSPDIRIIGVSMERGPGMFESLKAGKPVPVDEEPTLADALGGGIGLDNAHTFGLVRDLVDDIVLVSELQIAEAVRHAYWEERQIVEGSGAVGIAALMRDKIAPQGPIVVVLTGGNIDMALHHRIISGENVDVAAERKAVDQTRDGV